MILSLWFLFFGISTLTILEFFKGGLSLILEFDFFLISSNQITFSILVDEYSLLFSYCLLMIVSSVFAFSSIYMKGDVFESRFKCLVLLFVFSMILLIFIPELLFTLIGWDGLGISSFLLMIYYLSNSSWNAGMKTYLINRLGDGFFLLALSLLVIQGNWNLMSLDFYFWFGMFFVLGCFTKSAQYPFSSWLPDAMAAPTPVSALVHSSTLVTAGLFLLIRFFDCLPNSFFFILGLVGFWTMSLASLAACLEYDSKKIMAFSTLSQLGLIMVSISLGFVQFAFFHLLTHAVFKALLFITSGYKIYVNNHFQDIRFLKSSFLQSFLKNFLMKVCILSLMGFPFLAGFFSKESILESSFWVWKKIYFFCFYLSIPLTAYYSTRLLLISSSNLWGSKLVSTFDKGVTLLSYFPLFMLTLSTGYFFSIGGEFLMMDLMATFFNKMIVFILMVGGVLFAVFNNLSLKFFSFVYFSELSFLKTFKGSFFLNYFSENFFIIYSTMDLGINNSLINFMKNSLKNSAKILNEISMFFNSLKSKIMSISFLFLMFVLLMNF